MAHTTAEALRENFLGNSPIWYKQAIIGFLIVNPILTLYDPFIAGWALVLQFIFTLAMALKCYPLQPGGLLALEAVVIGLTSSGTVYHEAGANFEVILLLIFMVAGIFFLKDLLLYIFTKIMIRVKSKILLSLLFSFAAAVLSAFLDALTHGRDMPATVQDGVNALALAEGRTATAATRFATAAAAMDWSGS